MPKTILITGATAGIGKATAYRFARENYRLILTGRRKELLTAIASELQQRYLVEIRALSFDIRKKDEVEQNLESLDGEWRNIDILVNNAGLAAGLDPVNEASTDDWDTMIDTNVKGLLYISRKVMPWMIGQGSGHIFNIGSIAGKEVYPKGSVYAATKHAVDALTKGMRIDLLPYGIRVTQISPGAVETEFSNVRFKGDAERASMVYKGYEPLQGEDIAEIIHFIVNLPDRVNVNDILVMPRAQANVTTFHKI
ncbi:MAG: SDR family NAD(P)-dependent oxidoreductase [Bacteroidales bacterium]|jgi:NADP-dependent 3-hydroxy acid dehydrogenase YdfG|nr:SDR family NAD(P)-dependent oxidoreductase [Bacteroidales bacterium]